MKNLKNFFRMTVYFWIIWYVNLAAQPFSFSITSDQRSYTTMENSTQFKGVCLAIAERQPTLFMISPGDIDPPDRILQNLQMWIRPDYIWYPVVGNHELPGGGSEAYSGANMEWLRAFNPNGNTLPNIVNTGPPGCVETTYSFDYGNAHFVVLNVYYDGQSDKGPNAGISDALYDWLRHDLLSTDKPFIFVSGHEPMFPSPDRENSKRRHVNESLDQYPEQRDRLLKLMQNMGVTAYLCGHTHCYSVTQHENVWQIDSGHARGQQDDLQSTFLIVDVEQDRISFSTFRDHYDGGPYSLYEEGAVTPAARHALISAGAMWSYLDDGSDAGTSWRLPNFVDDWNTGPSPLGFGDGDEATKVGYGDDASQKYVTTYFRHSFFVHRPDLYQYYTLRVQRDDGIVVYLNGTEIVRHNMPADSIEYTTRALNVVSGDNESYYFTFFIDPTLITTGENVIAAEVHQQNRNSSDLHFDLLLYGHVPLPTLDQKVWNDMNGNGRQDPEEPGLAGVTMCLLDRNQDTLRIQTTDEEGACHFYNIRAGIYTIDIDQNTLPTNYFTTTCNDPYDISVTPFEKGRFTFFGYQPLDKTQDTLTYNFPNPGWYLVSLPGMVNDSRIMNLFPDYESEEVYEWKDQSFVQTRSMRHGHGYLMYVEKTFTQQVVVWPIQGYHRSFEQPGWYLIGSTAANVTAAKITTTPTGSFVPPLMEMKDDTYVPITTLKPQSACWAYVKSKCKFHVLSDLAATNHSKDHRDFSEELRKTASLPPLPPYLTSQVHETTNQFQIYTNYPNPFNAQTVIEYDLDRDGFVQINVYNLLGKKVRHLTSAYLAAGRHRTIWDGRNETFEPLPSGLYFVNVAAEKTKIIKVMLLR